MGDYNNNTLSESNKTIKQTNEFSNIFSSNYYHKLICLPTRENKYSSTLIDNIYTNIPDSYNTCSSGVLKFLTRQGLKNSAAGYDKLPASIFKKCPIYTLNP